MNIDQIKTKQQQLKQIRPSTSTSIYQYQYQNAKKNFNNSGYIKNINQRNNQNNDYESNFQYQNQNIHPNQNKTYDINPQTNQQLNLDSSRGLNNKVKEFANNHFDNNQKRKQQNYQEDARNNIEYQAKSYLKQDSRRFYNQPQRYQEMILRAYLRLDIIRVNSLEISKNKGFLSAIIYLDIDATSLEPELINFIKENVTLMMSYEQKNRFLKLSQKDQNDNYTEFLGLGSPDPSNPRKKFIRFRIFNIFETRLITNINWTPNQIANMVFSIKIQKIVLNSHDQFNNLPKNIQQKYQTQNQILKNLISKNSNSFQSKSKNRNQNSNGLIIRFNLMEYKYNLYRKSQSQKQIVRDQAQVLIRDDVNLGMYVIAQNMIQHQFTFYKTSKFQQDYFNNQRNWFNKSCFARFFQPKSLLDNKILRSQEDKDEQSRLSQDKNDRESQIINYRNSKTVCNAHYVIPMVRKPMISFIKLFLPTYIFALAAIVLLWTPLGDNFIPFRIAPLTFIFLALLTRMSLFRDEIPKTLHISYIQIVQYILAFIPIICLIQTFVGAVRPDYQYRWYTDPFFWTSFVCLIIGTIFFILFILRYLFYSMRKTTIVRGIRRKLNLKQWQPQAMKRRDLLQF